MVHKVKLAFGLVAAAVALSASVPAAASTMVVRSISHADLDLTTEDGAAALQKRVRSAVRLVCGTAAPIHGIDTARPVKDCRKAAWAVAEPQIALAVERSRRGFAGHGHESVVRLELGRP